jgi:hypothetical protein
MFILRSLCWLAAVVMLLPPAEGGEPAPRVNLLHAAYSARVIAQDLTGVCQRNPEACAASRSALDLLTRKIETGADIVSAGLTASDVFRTGGGDHGSLRPDDLALAWSAPSAK